MASQENNSPLTSHTALLTMKAIILSIAMLLCGLAVQVHAATPNIVLIYTDDLGYADVGCYGAKGVETPHIDRLAREGLRFTDAHCSAATCTPSRFALLTGSYAFRQKGTGILSGNAGMIIKPGSVTMPSQLQKAGYKTGVVGKWHLGLGAGDVNWNGDVKPGPREIGFDYHYLIPATGDRVPCVYLEQGKVENLDPADPITTSYGKRIDNAPSGKEARDSLKMDWSHGHNSTIVNGISRIGWMTGGEKARWVDEDMADVITSKAVSFIDENREQSFFLYFSTHDIHVPRVPHPRFVGKSSMGPRGDAIAQTDWCVGELLKVLDERKLTENTLVIFTSDNGPVLDDGYHDDANEKLGGHDPNGPYRGGKYSLFEGGTRVPFIVRWPGHVEAGATSDALFGQVDLAASFSKLTETEIASDALLDSRDELDTLLGKDGAGRPHLIHEAGQLALRVGQWKFIPGGNSREELGPWKGVKLPESGALYDLSSDSGELKDLSEEQPEQLAKMRDLLQQLRQKHDGDR